MSAAARCPACGCGPGHPLGTVGPVPVLCGSLWPSRAEALDTPTGELTLAGCSRCGHVWNSGFIPALVEYDARYDNALEFSPTFRAYAEALVTRLLDRFDLRCRRVAEIGSGKGEFLRLLCAAGGNLGVGYDPTYEGPAEVDGVTFVRAFLGPGTKPGDVDFLCCRHVLEHVAHPYDFLLGIQAAVGGRPIPMYVEVPNAEFNFAESGPWDLIYPHVSYFSDTSLRALLSRAGYRVLSLEPSFGGQFLGAEVVPDPPETVPSPDAAGTGVPYADALARQLADVVAWRGRLAGIRDGGGSVGLWGAGSKGVTFLSLVDPNRDIGMVVDANPRKWGRYLPGSGHQVVAPTTIADRPVDTVLVMNPVYAGEIRRCIARLGASAEVLVV